MSSLSRLVIASVAVALSGCGPAAAPPEESEPGASSRQDIVGGTPTSDFPAAGAITRWGAPHCTGTLIEKRKVLTAAHCLEGVSASSLKFVTGATVSAPESATPVASFTAHPKYDSKSLVNDIGYLTLAADAPVPPMNVLPAMDGSWVGKDLVFVGYGKTGGSSGGSGVKRSVTMPVKSIDPKTFLYKTSGKNTCNGDSGGPAFGKLGGEWYVAGVTSYGDIGCTSYGVDTRADAFAEFIAGQSGAKPEAPEDPCQGESYAGRCEGNLVVWCENGAVQKQACGAGKACEFAPQAGYHACISADPCQGETYQGRCDGSTVVWCENDAVKKLDCKACGFDQQKGFYNCL
jgi:hypothetical protein